MGLFSFFSFFFPLPPPPALFLIVRPNKFQKKTREAAFGGVSADRCQVTERALLKKPGFQRDKPRHVAFHVTASVGFTLDYVCRRHEWEQGPQGRAGRGHTRGLSKRRGLPSCPSQRCSFPSPCPARQLRLGLPAGSRRCRHDIRPRRSLRPGGGGARPALGTAPASAGTAGASPHTSASPPRPAGSPGLAAPTPPSSALPAGAGRGAPGSTGSGTGTGTGSGTGRCRRPLRGLLAGTESGWAADGRTDGCIFSKDTYWRAREIKVAPAPPPQHQ